jgi:hypothetical protein
MLPAEKELARLEAEQTELKERVTSAEFGTGNNQNGDGAVSITLLPSCGAVICAVG